MIVAVDTNVLLRALVDDDAAPSQCISARALIESAGRVHVSAAVFLETLWTLTRSYRLSRHDAVRAGRALLEHPKYLVEDGPRFETAIELFATGNIDLADAVALTQAQEHGAVLHTFDRKLAKLDGTALCK